MTSAPQSNPAVFTPEAVAAINRAYMEACHIVAGEGAQEQLRYELADRITYLARSGETDEHRLCSLSVAAVLGRVPDPNGNGHHSHNA